MRQSGGVRKCSIDGDGATDLVMSNKRNGCVVNYQIV
jgi:hypothetical protein